MRAGDTDDECHVGLLSYTEPGPECFPQSFGHNECFFLGSDTFGDEGDGEEGGARRVVAHDL